MPTASRARVWWYALPALLLLLRLPSLAQPAGGDQGLYAYIGTRILHGDLPYRDAWDQKPPAIHAVYALMFGVWPHDSVVAAADLAAAAAVAAMLIPLARAVTGSAAAGVAAASLFLLLGDPTLTRLAGVRVRAQCETFVAVAVTAALLLAVTSRGERARLRMLGIGALLGVAVTLKYNTAVYAPVAVAAAWIAMPPQTRRAAAARLLPYVVAGLCVPIAAMLLVFAAGGALRALYDATITYNLLYSGETYDGLWSFARYLMTFPIQQARVDALWTIGGLGCAVLLIDALVRGLSGRLEPRLLLPVVWVSAACLSIAINGSRGLPQYFVQAAPALALAAATAGPLLWPATRVAPRSRWIARGVGLALVAIAVWRVTDLPKIPWNASHDLAYLLGRISPEEHLARYGGRADDKYSAVGVRRLGEYLRARTDAGDRVYIFGFSPGAYVRAGRASSSRFFWSRPVLVGFNADAPGYGSRGVLDELRARPPAYVVLQVHDWAPPPGDSATFFLTDPLLSGWLTTHYRRAADVRDEDYDVWVRHADSDGR